MSCIINPLQETIRGYKLKLVPLLPDGTCKRRLNTIRNILEMPQISLLFMIPDISITLRVNGQAQITFDPDILSRFVVKERLPKMVMVVTVQEAYGHCAKAIRRGKLWQDNYKVGPSEAPSLAELMSHHLSLRTEEINQIDKTVVQDLKDSMY